MPNTPPLRPRFAALAGVAAISAAAPMAGCGTVEVDRQAVATDIGLAYGAYVAYVSEPAEAGKLTPSTPSTAAVRRRATAAARYATRSLEAARNEAAPDPKLASFAQKTAAAAASLNAVGEVLDSGRPSRGLVAGGRASLESLTASARDLEIKVARQPVPAADLDSPPEA
jgi:hypothetical protein